MTLFSCCTTISGSVGLVVGCLMFWSADCVSGAPFEDVEEPEGLVWFIGTVERVTDGIPVIDLGEVQTLRQGSLVAAIRYRDSHFSPLGVLEVHFSHPTWCQTVKPKSFAPEVGDLVMFVEAPGDLGSGDAIRDAFIRHRIVANSNRNRYSSISDTIEADTLQQVLEKQPNWLEGQRRIAGIILSPSVTRDMNNRLKPFVNQIQMFQDYQDQGVDVAQVLSEPWRSVLDELRLRKKSSDSKTNEVDVDAAAVPIATENKVDPDKLVTVRRQVDDSMFQNFVEERTVIAVICATLLQTKTSNERRWMSQQLAKSQFPALSSQEQMLIDMEAVMRRVRQTEQ